MKKSIIALVLALVMLGGTVSAYNSYMSDWFYQSTYQTLGQPQVNENLTVYARRSIPMLILGRTLIKAGSLAVVNTSVISPFTDLGYLYPTDQQVIVSMYLNGIVQGNGDGTFTPEKFVTRAQMTALVYRTYNKVSGRSATNYYSGSQGFYYNDLEGHWAKDEVNAATALGIVDGNGNGTFSPDAFVTIEESLKMITRMCELLGLDLNQLAAAISSTIDVVFYGNISGGGYYGSYDYNVAVGSSINVYFDNISTISSYTVNQNNIVTVTKYSKYLKVKGNRAGTVQITARNSSGRTETKVIRVGSGSGNYDYDYDYTVSTGNSVKVYFDNISNISSYSVSQSNIVTITKYNSYLLVYGRNNGIVEITARNSNGRTETKIVRVGYGSNSGNDERPYHDMGDDDTGRIIDAR